MGFSMTCRLLLVLMTSSHVLITSASVISFTKTPSIIKPILTKQLTIKCALEDSLVGTGLVGKRDVTQTSTNIKQLISLVVVKNGQDIASITPFTQATALGGDQGSLNVTGAISTSTGHLLLEWSYPGEAQSGNMSCEANGINAAGHNTVFSTSLVVGVQEPSLSDLVDHVHRQEIQMLEQRDMLDQQQQQIGQQQATIDDQQKKMEAEKLRNDAEHAAQQTLIGNLTQEMDRLRQEVQQGVGGPGHVESGIIDCQDSTSWSTDQVTFSGYQYYITKSVRQSFTKSYSQPPVVQLSIVTYFAYQADYRAMYSTFLKQVDVDGFTMYCSTNNNTYGRIDKMVVSWVSIAG